MASNNKDDIGVRPISVPNWGLGIITSQAPTEIPDNAAQDILNMEFDDSDNLASRYGLTQLFATTFASRPTSLHYFTSGSGEIGLLYTTGSQVRIVETNGTGDTNLTGALTLPNDTFWQWITYKDLAIGVNKATSGDNPIKVSTGSVAAALGGSPPKGKYIALWNNRVWIVSATEPNQLWGSALGLPEDWTVDDDAGAVTIDVEVDDGDQISGLFATREALYVSKRKRIYKVVPIDPAQAPTKASNLKVVLHAQTIGAVSPYSFAPIVNHNVFFSDSGLASLSLAEAAEDFREALFSRNVAELAKIPKTTEEIPTLLLPEVSQFWISIPASISTRQIDETYVMDYTYIHQGIDKVRWTRFDGLAAFTAATSFIGANGKVYVLGAKNANGLYQLFTYLPRNAVSPLSDNGTGYTKQLTTKAFTAELPLIRKWWKKWGLGIGLLSNDAQIAVQYFMDGNLNRGGDYNFARSGTGQGALWDQAEWDVASWDSAVTVPIDIIRRFLSNSSGQKSQNVAFIVSNGQNNEGIVIKHFMLWSSLLSERLVSDE